jgi:hypothetical protein
VPLLLRLAFFPVWLAAEVFVAWGIERQGASRLAGPLATMVVFAVLAGLWLLMVSILLGE